MSDLKLVLYPDPVLCSPCRELTQEELGSGMLDEWRIPDLADEMFRMMIENNGVGLASPQVGLPVRMFVAKIKTAIDTPLALVNPVVKGVEGETSGMEGCLSLPGVTSEVKRSEKITLEGLSPKGEFQLHELVGMEARIVQHEVDHLDGIVFIQRVQDKEYRELMLNLSKILREEKGNKKYSQNTLTRNIASLYDRRRRESK